MSLLTERPVHHAIGMTGEVTLRGRVPRRQREDEGAGRSPGGARYRHPAKRNEHDEGCRSRCARRCISSWSNRSPRCSIPRCSISQGQEEQREAEASVEASGLRCRDGRSCSVRQRIVDPGAFRPLARLRDIQLHLPTDSAADPQACHRVVPLMLVTANQSPDLGLANPTRTKSSLSPPGEGDEHGLMGNGH
jgi:hypothetical protein